MDRKEYTVRLLIAALIIGFVYTLVVARQLVLISFIGIGIAVVVNPSIVWLKNKFKVPRTLGAFFIFFSILVSISVVLFLIGKISTDQLASLSKDIPSYSQKLEGLLKIEVGPFGQLSSLVEGVDFNSVLSNIVSKITNILKSTVIGISGATISFVIAFFLSVSSKYYRKQLPIMVNSDKKEEFTKLLKRLSGTLRAYFNALIIDMFAISLITSLGLYLVGFKYWIVIGVVTGFFCLIPYVGIITVAVITCLLALAHDVSQIPYVLGVFVLTQQLEGNFIFPLIMRNRVALPEAPLLIFILFMAQLFGVLGAFIAAPLLAVGLDIINWKRSDENKLFKLNSPMN